MLAKFLPVIHQLLIMPTNRGQDMLDTWKLAMQGSREAAENADELMVPSFHWARVYRI
jgi:hypothetical protein